MTRRIIYANQLGESLQYLYDEKERMLEYGFIAQAILGTSTLLSGFACTPASPASLSVNLAQGVIFYQTQVDATAYGQLPSQIPADTTDEIVKFGYQLSTVQKTFVPPAIAGQSRNDLIQIGFSETDGNLQNVPFWTGTNGQGIPNPPDFQSLNTQRITNAVVQVKTGVPAATGTQVTPTPDPGFVGAWVITTANGQTQILSGDIAQYPNAPFISETLTQKISQATADLRYGQISTIQSGGYVYAVDTGVANAYVGTLSPAITSYTTGMAIKLKIANANTGASTVNFNSLGVKNIKILGGYDPFPGELATLAELYYDGTEFILLNPAKIAISGSVYPSAPTSIPGTNTPTKVTFDTVLFDPCLLFDGTNKKFILKRPGTWNINAALFFSLNPSGNDIFITVYLNGSIYKRLAEDPSGGGIGDEVINGNCLIRTTGSTDYVEIFANSSGSTINVGSGPITNGFEATYVGS